MMRRWCSPLQEGGERMGCETTKLVYSDEMPLWLTSDGSLVPAVRGEDGALKGIALYLKDRSGAMRRLYA